MNTYLVTEYRGKTTEVSAQTFETVANGDDVNVVFLDAAGQLVAFFMRPWSVELTG